MNREQIEELIDNYWDSSAFEIDLDNINKERDRAINKILALHKAEVERILNIIDGYKVDEVMTVEIKTVSDIKEFFNQHIEKISKAIKQTIRRAG